MAVLTYSTYSRHNICKNIVIMDIYVSRKRQSLPVLMSWNPVQWDQ